MVLPGLHLEKIKLAKFPNFQNPIIHKNTQNKSTANIVLLYRKQAVRNNSNIQKQRCCKKKIKIKRKLGTPQR